MLYVWLDRIWHREMLPATNKAVFITGCDSGFGRALTERLDSLGIQVLAGCYTERGEAELRQGFHNVYPLHIDTADTHSIEQAYSTVKNILKGKELWGVVNNAGISGVGGPIEFITRKDLLDTFNVNMAGMAEVARVFLPALKQSRGRLVNMVSLAGRISLPDMGQYTASKYAMEGYSDCQRRELAAWGISVSILNPGFFRTGIIDPDKLRKGKEAQLENVDEDVKKSYPDYAERSVSYASKYVMGKVMLPDLTAVIDAYTHALLAKRPRHRYILGGWDSKFAHFLSLLPGSAGDLFIRLQRRHMSPNIGK